MKKVLIIGANGKVGRILTQKMKDSSHFSPVAAIRKEEQLPFFENLGVQHQLLSLEDSVTAISRAMEGVGAVVFSAGSGGNTGHDMTLKIDLDGALKTMEAAESAGVKRFVIVSALNADRRDRWEASGILPYYIAKHTADRILKYSDLDYTILRPGLLLDEPGNGKIDTEDPESQRGVAREDVASVVMEVLKQDNSIGKIIEFNGGNTPIEQAVIAL